LSSQPGDTTGGTTHQTRCLTPLTPAQARYHGWVRSLPNRHMAEKSKSHDADAESAKPAKSRNRRTSRGGRGTRTTKKEKSQQAEMVLEDTPAEARSAAEAEKPAREQNQER